MNDVAAAHCVQQKNSLKKLGPEGIFFEIY